MVSEQHLRNIKCDLAVTYVRAIAAHCNFAFQETTRSYDGIGIDCSITNFHIGSKPLIPTPGNEIKLQVKGFSRSSTSMYRDNGNTLKYKIENITPASMLYYLVILELPEEERLQDWLETTPDALILKKCAYYVRIKETLSTGFVDIPKSQLFNTESLPKLFINTVDEFIKQI